MRNNYVDGIDYKIVKLSTLQGVGQYGPTRFHKELSKKELQKLGGKDKQTDIYLLSRVTLNRICVDSTKPIAKLVAHSFAKIYEIFQKFLIELRRKAVDSNREHKIAEPEVKERVNVLASQKMERADVARKAVEYEKCKKELEDKDIELEQTKKKNIELETTIKDLMKKLEDEKQKNSKLEEKSDLSVIRKKYSKLKIKYDLLKTCLKCSLEELIQEHKVKMDFLMKKVNTMESIITKQTADIKKYEEILKEKDIEVAKMGIVVNKYKEENSRLKKDVDYSDSESESEDEEISSDEEMIEYKKPESVSKRAKTCHPIEEKTNHKEQSDLEHKFVKDENRENKNSENKKGEEQKTKTIYTENILKTKKNTELHTICKDNKLRGFYKYNKEELIKFILKHIK